MNVALVVRSAELELALLLPALRVHFPRFRMRQRKDLALVLILHDPVRSRQRMAIVQLPGEEKVAYRPRLRCQRSFDYVAVTMTTAMRRPGVPGRVLC